MDLKKLFKDIDAVSPVIGVILMVAITVILAAAIGSSVFGNGPEKSAPQANIDVKANATGNATAPGSIKIEHLGGDTLKFGTNATTKITVTLGENSSDIDATSLGDFSVGDMKIVQLNTLANGKPASGDIVNIKIIDVNTNQLVINKDVRF
jgi:archaeal type IV pilus assembly protein PilA